MLRKRLVRYSVLGLLLCASGCNFFRERLCCNRPGILTGRFGGSASHPVETVGGDCACEGTLTSGGPMLGAPIIQGPGDGGAILPNPNPNPIPIPQIKENPGRQGIYEPGMSSRSPKGNETKNTK
jgi:hypothetical protein